MGEGAVAKIGEAFTNDEVGEALAARERSNPDAGYRQAVYGARDDHVPTGASITGDRDRAVGIRVAKILGLQFADQYQGSHGATGSETPGEPFQCGGIHVRTLFG